MKVAVIGANGQLGSDICSVFRKQHEVIALSIDDIDITEFSSCEVIKSYVPDIVINTAAYHNLPKCEENPAQAFAVNAVGTWNVAKICFSLDIPLVHISTDYVFDGEKKKPYTEADKVSPLSAYGISKVAGEQFLGYTSKKFFIVRTSGLYGEHKCLEKERNFPELMVYLYKQGKDLKVVNDEYLTPTFTYDLALQLAELVTTDQYGIYHITNKDFCSWHEFAVKLFELLNIDVKVTPVSASVFPSPVLRPGYSVLENAHLKDIGLDHMRSWEEALADYISREDLLKKV